MFRGFSRGFRDSVFGDSFSGGDSVLGDSKTLRGFSSKGFRDSGFSGIQYSIGIQRGFKWDSGFRDSACLQRAFRVRDSVFV